MPRQPGRTSRAKRSSRGRWVFDVMLTPMLSESPGILTPVASCSLALPDLTTRGAGLSTSARRLAPVHLAPGRVPSSRWDERPESHPSSRPSSRDRPIAGKRRVVSAQPICHQRGARICRARDSLVQSGAAPDSLCLSSSRRHPVVISSSSRWDDARCPARPQSGRDAANGAAPARGDPAPERKPPNPCGLIRCGQPRKKYPGQLWRRRQV